MSSSQLKTSVSLLERLRHEDQDYAWTRFVGLYAPLLFYWARRMGCQEAEAADLVQEVLLLLMRKLPEFSYDRHRTFRGWLRIVARNCWMNLGRKAALPIEAGSGHLAAVASPEDDDPFWEIEYRDRLVARALEMMQAEFQPTTWKACWDTIVGGKQPADVARELGISVGAVYMAKSRVLSRLRQELAGLFE